MQCASKWTKLCTTITKYSCRFLQDSSGPEKVNISIGDHYEVKHRFTRSDVDLFIRLTGDTNYLHSSNESNLFNSRIFQGPIVHGALINGQVFFGIY